MLDLLNNKYKPFLDARDKAISGKDEIDPNENSDSMPLPYMIVKSAGAEDTDLALESNGLLLCASKLVCKYVKSKPTGGSNNGVSNTILNKYSSEKASSSKAKPAATNT